MSNNHKTNVKHVALLFLATLAWAASACTAKVEGGGDVPVPVPLTKPTPDDFKSAIEGPKVDGVWKSDCVQSARDASKFNLITMTIQGQNVNRVSDNFSDEKCQHALDTLTQKGLLRYEKLNYFGQYDVEYRFEMTGGTYSQYEVFGFENDVLTISNLIGGDVKADVKMTKQQDPNANPQPSPNPSPTPSPEPVLKPADKAYSYGTAKYAFCETQGSGTMVDFKGTDLSKNGEGLARLGTKSCNSSNEIHWGATDVKITVTMLNGKPQIAFPDSHFTSIKPYSYQDGLGNYGASAMMGGNSGECFFLSNDGTQNLPFVYSCY